MVEPNLPQLHPRYFVTEQASAEIGLAIIDAIQRHDLTIGETVQILADEIQRHTKYLIRRERHGRTNKRGDEA